MNKEELVEIVAEQTGYSKASVRRTVDGLLDTIKECVSNNDSISLFGFGTFSSQSRNARVCRNPQTGESINVPAKSVPHFKAGKRFKEAVASEQLATV